MRLEIVINWDRDPVPEGTEHSYDAILTYEWDSSDDRPKWDWWFEECELVPHNEAARLFLEQNPKEEERVRDLAIEQGWDKIKEEGLVGKPRRTRY